MSKKHFEALAAALRASQPNSDDHGGSLLTQWQLDVDVVTEACARFNPNFDRARFLAACGVEG